MNRATYSAAATRALVVAVLAVLACVAILARSPIAQPAQPMRMVATVRSVDTKTRVLEVLTGVGHSVRVTRLQVAEDCQITVPWAAAHLSSFIPGTNALIEYVAAPAKTRTTIAGVVTSIEAIDVEHRKVTP